MKMSWDQYFMAHAETTKIKSTCSKRQVGTVIVKDNHIIAHGFNGTPSGTTNCKDGGCYRCSHPLEFPSGIGYAHCTCIHSELNAILMVAKFGGVALKDTALYTTLQPCLACLISCVQVKINKIRYKEAFIPNEKVQRSYTNLSNKIKYGVHQEVLNV